MTWQKKLDDNKAIHVGWKKVYIHFFFCLTVTQDLAKPEIEYKIFIISKNLAPCCWIWWTSNKKALESSRCGTTRTIVISKGVEIGVIFIQIFLCTLLLLTNLVKEVNTTIKQLYSISVPEHLMCERRRRSHQRQQHEFSKALYIPGCLIWYWSYHHLTLV